MSINAMQTDVLQHSRTPSLVLQNAPRLLDNARLVDDLAAQSKHVSSTKPVVHIQHLTQLQVRTTNGSPDLTKQY